MTGPRPPITATPLSSGTNPDKSSVTFSVPTGNTNANANQSLDASKRSNASSNFQKQRRRRSSRSSFFGRMGSAFRKAGGEDAADAETLRGTTGANFESKAVIFRTESEGVGCGCFGGGGLRKNKKNTTKERLLIIKGPFCFVYSHEDDPAPKYALSLAQLAAVQQKKQLGNINGKYAMVALESSLGDSEYTIGFPDQEVADKFIATVRVQAAEGKADLIRKELGHSHLASKRSSVKYAEQVAKVKTEKQPTKDDDTTPGMLATNVAMSSGATQIW